MLASKLGSKDLALQGALAKAAGNQDARCVAQNLINVFGIEALTIDQLHIYVTIVENARVMQGLDNRQICIGKLGVLSHDGNLNLIGVMVGMVLLAQELIPCAHIALARIEAKALANAQVKVLLREQLRHVVNARAILVGKDTVGVDVAETRDLAADSVINMVIGAQHNNVGLDTKAAQLLDGVLRGLGLNLVGGGDIGNERYVDVADVLGTGLLAVLADSLHERLRLDVADRATQLGNDNVGASLLLNAAEFVLDSIGDVRDHLDGTAQKVTATLAGNQALVNGARRKVRIAGQVLVNKALVVAQVQIGLVAVLGHKDLTVLERAHGTGVDVQIRVGLLHRHLVAARLEQTAQRCRGNALAQRRNHAAGHKHMLSHIELPALPVEVVHTHLTGLHCNTRERSSSPFFTKVLAFLHLETKRRPGPERRNNNLGGRSLPIGKLVPEHIPNEHTRADAFQIPPATLGKANTICKLAAILAITRNDLDQTVRIQALNCGAGSIRRHPNVLRKRFAREAICPATFGLLGNLHQHQHFDTLHIVDTRTTLARHGSLL